MNLTDIASLYNLDADELRRVFGVLGLDADALHSDDIVGVIEQIVTTANGGDLVETARRMVAASRPSDANPYSVDAQYAQVRQTVVNPLIGHFTERVWEDVHGGVGAVLTGQATAPGKSATFTAPSLTALSSVVESITTDDLTAALPGSSSAVTATKALMGHNG